MHVYIPSSDSEKVQPALSCSPMKDGMFPPPLTTVKEPPLLWVISAPFGENHCPMSATLDPELQ